MKTATLIVMFLVLAVGVQAIGGAEIKAAILRYEPTPAEQGGTVDVWVQLSNAGTKADMVSVKFLQEYPFSLPSGQKAEAELGTIAATESRVQKFTVYVAPDASNGDANIKFLFKYSSVDEWVQLEAPITLQAQDASLVIENYKVNPAAVIPGQPVTVQVNLRNTGRIAVKNIDVEIGLEEGKFSTTETGTKQRIDRIAAGEEKTIAFTLVSDTTTEVKVYSLPVSLSYQDEKNKKHADTARISLMVNSEPEVSLTVDSTKFENRKSPGAVSLKIVNKGITNLKYMTMSIVQTDEYEVLNPSNEAYIGNLDSDDFETAEFIIKPLAEIPRLKLRLDFKDQYNVDFTRQYDLPLRIITEKELGKKPITSTIIVILLILIAGIVYWRYRQKKKR